MAVQQSAACDHHEGLWRFGGTDPLILRVCTGVGLLNILGEIEMSVNSSNETQDERTGQVTNRYRVCQGGQWLR